MKMPTITPAVRVSFGLVMFTLSVLLIADMFGIIPKKHTLMIDARKKISESIAVQLSVAATKSDQYIIDMTLESFVERNDDVLGAQLSKANGRIISSFGIFEKSLNTEEQGASSTDNIVLIPIYAGSNKWGSVKIEFASIYKDGLWAFITDTVAGMLIFVALASIGGYIYILRKALHVLDPKKVVPERVKAAFNALAEGVLILDNKEQIMMANDAFAEQVNKDADRLIGSKVSDLKWKVRKHDQDKTLPWVSSLRDGIRHIGVAMNLSTSHNGVRAMSTNSAPILDDEGKSRGALVTFDDITDAEESNVLLENAVDTLQKSTAEVRRKNRELEILASRDSLTGCYNRRAFFDLVEDMYEQTHQTNSGMICIMIDLDHFKSINDSFGHAFGDEALRMTSEILNGCEQEGAVVGRYGGEEFSIALPGIGLAKGKQVADCLREKIIAASAKLSSANISITASFGIAAAENDISSFSELLEHSDKALYLAKETGRNRVVTWPEVLTSMSSAQVQTDMNYRTDANKVIDGKFEENSSSLTPDLLQSRIHDLENEISNINSDHTRALINDPITNLPTSLIFEDRISQAMAFSSRTENLMSVVILNVNMFNRINNTLGQVVGDEFLKAVGQRLKTVLRNADTVASMTIPGQAGPSLARLNDDEFALLLTGIDNTESLTYITNRIQEKLSGKIVVADNELFLTTTIGLSLYPTDGDTPKALIENARAAQKQAKSKPGRNNYQFFSQEINRVVVDQMKLELDLHNALENTHFKMVYQPKVDVVSENISCMEALIRWDHPEKGLIMPLCFIPAAEKSGLIVEIGKWSLNVVCRQAKEWVDMGISDLRVSVNISGIEFVDDSFVSNVLNALKDSGLNAMHLELEVTESSIMSDLEKSSKIIDDLRYRGVTVTLDDFGTGYSSFSYLGDLNFDWIKLDRKFLVAAMKNERSSTLYAGMVSMAKKMDLKIVAEGVETQAEYNYVRKMGIDQIQGYLVGKPIGSSSMLHTMLEQSSKRTKPKKAM